MTLCSSADEAVEDADIVCTTTFGGEPCLTSTKSLKQGVHINGLKNGVRFSLGDINWVSTIIIIIIECNFKGNTPLATV